MKITTVFISVTAVFISFLILTDGAITVIFENRNIFFYP